MNRELLAIAFALLAVALSLGCTDETAARHAVKAMGFTSVRVLGWSPMSCGKDDWSCTEFDAMAADGSRKVTGVVGCGLFFKGCTVRFK